MCFYMFAVNAYSLFKEIGQVYYARQKYDAIGNRSTRVLSFDKGEEMEVFNPISNSEWWEVSCIVLN